MEVVETRYKSRLETPKPQYAVIILMAIIVIGILVFVIVDIFTPGKPSSEFDEFDSPIEKKSNRDDLSGTNRHFLTS